MDEAARHWSFDPDEHELTDSDGDTWPRSGVVVAELPADQNDSVSGLPLINIAELSKYSSRANGNGSPAFTGPSSPALPVPRPSQVLWRGATTPASTTELSYGRAPPLSPNSKIRPPTASQAVRQALSQHAIRSVSLHTPEHPASEPPSLAASVDRLPVEAPAALAAHVPRSPDSSPEPKETPAPASTDLAIPLLNVSGDKSGTSPQHSPRLNSSTSLKRQIRLLRENSEMCVSEVVENAEIQITPTTPKQVRLIWEHQPQTILVIKKREEPAITNFLREMANWLKQEKNIEVLVEPDVQQKELQELKTWTQAELSTLATRVDLVICLGGDGTVLHVNSLFQESTPPVVAFNLGSLGFLTPFKIGHYKRTISPILQECFLTLRSRLCCVLVQYDEDGRESVQTYTVLNEVVIDRGSSPYLSHLECFCDDVHVTTIQADGIIVATTTGSTAYSLSAGGSMVHPQVPAIVFTPICPHSLSFRPLLFPDAVELKIQVPKETRACAWASFDGRYRTELKSNDYIIIRISKWPFVWVNKEDTVTDWFKSLADCLHWNDRRKQK